MTETEKNIALESKIQALEELLTVSETSFLEESQKLEEANAHLQEEVKIHERLENDIKQILECSGDAVQVVDKDDNIVYVNSAFLALRGIIDKKVIGRKCHDVTPEERCVTGLCPLKTILETGASFEDELQVKSESDITTSYRVSFIPYLNHDGCLVGMIRKFRDITQDKQVQKIAEENALQRGRIEMTSDMLHDIGNALSGINIFVFSSQPENEWPEINTLRQLDSLFTAISEDLSRLLGEEKEKALHRMIGILTSSLQARKTASDESALKLAASLNHISSILDLHRYYAREKGPQHAAIVNLRQLIDDALTILANSLKKRNIQIRISSTGEIPDVSGDRTRLMRMFLNIIKNSYEAFDASSAVEDRTLEIRIDATAQSREVGIVFSDNATGFSADIGEKLFERGFSTKPNGTGSGLPECRAIVESHGGKITVESQGPNTGAATVIRLPRFIKSEEK